MPTTYSPALRLALPATGEDSGTWGTIVNQNITAMIEQAITGSAAVVMPADADYTLITASGTTDQARCIVLWVTSSVSLTANRNIIVPTGAAKPYLVYNNTTGGQTITVKTAGGTGVALASGAYALVGSADGTNYAFFTPVTAGGGAAATATTANALNVSNTYQVNGLEVTGYAYTLTVAPTYGTTTTLNCALSNAFRIVLTGNITTLTVSNPSSGQAINVRFKQDATGNRTIAWPSSFRWAGGVVPVLSTAASAEDFLTAQYDATDTTWVCALLKGVQ